MRIFMKQNIFITYICVRQFMQYRVGCNESLYIDILIYVVDEVEQTYTFCSGNWSYNAEEQKSYKTDNK